MKNPWPVLEVEVSPVWFIWGAFTEYLDGSGQELSLFFRSSTNDRGDPAILELPLHQEIGVNKLMGNIKKLDAEMKIKQWVLEEVAIWALLITAVGQECKPWSLLTWTISQGSLFARSSLVSHQTTKASSLTARHKNDEFPKCNASVAVMQIHCMCRVHLRVIPVGRGDVGTNGHIRYAPLRLCCE